MRRSGQGTATAGPMLAMSVGTLAVCLWLGLGAAVSAWAAGRPAFARPAGAAPALDATASALLDADTGQILYARNAQAQVAVASATKLMTALITLEHARLDTVFAEPDYSFAAADSQIGLVPGERMSVHDLLLAMLLPSADDAALDLAHNVGGGSVSRFIAMMNARARQLGLRHTHYSTPIGLDTPGNYSSAGDLVKLARYDLRTLPFFRHAVSLAVAVLHSGDHPRTVVNLNDLVRRFAWIHGVKTGHTLQAGYVLVGAGKRDGMTLISAVLGTPSEAARDASTLALLGWGFAHFHLITAVRGGTVVARPRVRYRTGAVADVVAADTLKTVLPRGTPVRLRARVPAILTGPLARGARVGTLLVVAEGRVVGRVALLLAVSLPRVSPPGLSLARLGAPITLVLALVLMGAATLAAGGMRKRMRGRAAEARRRR